MTWITASSIVALVRDKPSIWYRLLIVAAPSYTMGTPLLAAHAKGPVTIWFGSTKPSPAGCVIIFNLNLRPELNKLNVTERRYLSELCSQHAQLNYRLRPLTITFSAYPTVPLKFASSNVIAKRVAPRILATGSMGWRT